MTQAVIQTDNLATKTEELDATYESFILSLEDGTGGLSEFAKGIVDAATNTLTFLTNLNNGKGALASFQELISDQIQSTGQLAEQSAALGISQKDLAQAYQNNGDVLTVFGEKLKNGEITIEQYRVLVEKLARGNEEATKSTEDVIVATSGLNEEQKLLIDKYNQAKGTTLAYTEENLKLAESLVVVSGEQEKQLTLLEKQLKLQDEFRKRLEAEKEAEKGAKGLQDDGLDELEKQEQEQGDADFEEFLAKEGLSDEDLERRKEALEEKQLQDEEANQLKFDTQLEQNELELEQEQAMADAKAEINQQIQDSAINLAGALINLAGDSQGAQLALLAFEKAVAIARVVTTTQAANAAIFAEGAALAIPTAGASVATATGLISANNINAALNVATILATAIPQVKSITAPKKLKDGEVMINGAGTETSDSIPAMLSKNESVINAKSTKKHTAALRAINDDRFEEYLNRVVMQRLYTGGRDAKDIKISTKKESINFPSRLNVGNARAISKPIVDAIEDSNFLKGAGWD